MKTRFSTLAFIILGALAPMAAMADGTTPTPIDTTGYTAVFTQLQSDMSSVATGPVGIGAFAVLTVGIIFRIVWKLYKRAPQAI